MDENGSPLDYASIASQFGEAKLLKEREDASEHEKEVDSAESTQKRKELQFKVSHVLLTLFFIWLL